MGRRPNFSPTSSGVSLETTGASPEVTILDLPANHQIFVRHRRLAKNRGVAGSIPALVIRKAY